jgi:hypothetical protein
MRLSIQFALLCTLAAWCGSLPFAYGGVINSPDAYILEHTEIEIGLGASAYSVEDSTGSPNSEFKITGFIDVGAFGYGQIGVSYLADGGMVGNAKIAILHEGIIVPAFAIGVENMLGAERVDCFRDENSAGIPDSLGGISGRWDEEGFYNYQHAQNWSAYGVASKDLEYVFGVPVTLNLGIGIGRFIGIIDGGALGLGSSIAHGLFGSAIYRPSEDFTIAFEQDGRDFNFGASYEISNLFTLHVVWAELEQAVFPGEGQSKSDIMQNSKVSIGLTSTFGPLIGARRLELEREQQRIERARARLSELEARRRSAEAELQRLRDLLEERR